MLLICETTKNKNKKHFQSEMQSCSEGDAPTTAICGSDSDLCSKMDETT